MPHVIVSIYKLTGDPARITVSMVGRGIGSREHMTVDGVGVFLSAVVVDELIGNGVDAVEGVGVKLDVRHGDER